MNYTLPPFTEPNIQISRTPSPVRENTENADTTVTGPVTGVELIVSKLPRNGILSAKQHLRDLLGRHFEENPFQPIVPVRIVPGDDRNPVDYVFLTIDSDVTQEPRPDLLEHLRSVLTTRYRLHVDWKVAKGADRTRRIYFHADSFLKAQALLPKLSDYLNRMKCPFQRSFISKQLNCVMFDLLDRASVQHLLDNPPRINGRTLITSAPHYIQPVYGLEVAVLGVQDVHGACSFLDNYIRSRYGDVIAASRLAYNGQAYCVVFKTWDQTSRFLADPFQAFDSCYGISHTLTPPTPALLYVHNSYGLILSPRWARSQVSPSTSHRHLQAQFDLLQQIVDNRARALEALMMIQQECMSQQIQVNAQTTAAFIASLSAIMSGSACLQATTARLDNLEAEARFCRFMLHLAQDTHHAHRETLIEQIGALQPHITAQRQTFTNAQNSLLAAECLIASLALPIRASQPLLSSPPLASVGTQSHTRSLEDPHEGANVDRRRLRLRTDDGPCPPQDGSTIDVDPDI